MNQTTIKHYPVELYDTSWELHMMEAGVVAIINDGWIEQHIKWDDMADVELLAHLFGEMSVASFKHLVAELGRLYAENTA